MKNSVLIGLTFSLFNVYSTGLGTHPTKLDSTRNNTLITTPAERVEYSNTDMRQEISKTHTLNNISKAQKELKLQGYYIGDIDGIVGDSTRSAIKKFQAHNTLDIDGELNIDTLEALNVLGRGSSYSE